MDLQDQILDPHTPSSSPEIQDTDAAIEAAANEVAASPAGVEPLESEDETTLEAPKTTEEAAEPETAEEKPTPTADTANEDVAPAAETAEEEPTWQKQYVSKQEVIDRLQAITESEEAINKDEIELLKTLFYRMRNAEREAQRQAYIESGGDVEQYRPEPDALEETFKAKMGIVKERRAQLFREQEAEKAHNLKQKLDIIEQLKNMLTTPEEVNRSYQAFKGLQQQWREIGAVPAERSSELWRTYQHYVEQYYDLLKLNNEAREYDFKKNLELKTHLCETAEKLDEEPDVISAFHQLQELHQQFREVGPVAKELREEIWNRFKAASTVINKKHQQHFESLRAQEDANLQAKIVLCEKVEAIIAEPATHSSQWEKLTKEVMALQAEWKTIGFAPQKMNVKIFERFRTACDTFFKSKTQFFKDMKARYAENIEKKKALVERAQALKDSEEWKETADALIALQKEWKTVGIVPKKVGDQLWADFQAACNHFFDARNAATKGQRTEQKANLERKQQIIDKLKALLEDDTPDVKKDAQALIDEYYNVGHVPFKDKDRIYAAFKEVADTLHAKHNVEMRRQRLDHFKNTLREVARKGEDAVDNERTRLMRQYESLKQEIQTYENNMGFFSISSKNGSTLLDEMSKKIERLKDSLSLVRDKIKAIDAAGQEVETPAEEAAQKTPAEEAAQETPAEEAEA